MSSSHSDYQNWGKQQMVKPIRAEQKPVVARPFNGVSTYGSEFVKHGNLAARSARPAVGELPSIPLGARTTYELEYTAKPIGAAMFACNDRPWMNCDSCKPSGNTTPDYIRERVASPEHTWTTPPFAIGKAKLEGISHSHAMYPAW